MPPPLPQSLPRLPALSKYLEAGLSSPPTRTLKLPSVVNTPHPFPPVDNTRPPTPALNDVIDLTTDNNIGTPVTQPIVSTVIDLTGDSDVDEVSGQIPIRGDVIDLTSD